VIHPAAVEGPRCTSSRDNAKAGQEVILTCAGFEPEEELILYWSESRESTKIDNVVVDEDGAGELTFLAPETPAGRYLMIVQSSVTRTTATVPIDINQALYIVPKSGDPGDVVNADLSGFEPGESVTLTWYENETNPRPLRVVTVGEDGSLTTTFRAPASSEGAHTITAVGAGGLKASAIFEIEPK
jgi:hypothetical protein